MLRGYRCECGTEFEHSHSPEDNVARCPSCGRIATERDEIMGGRACDVIVPMYPGSLKQKAGYVHTHGDRPAEKGSVAVPRTGEIK